MYGNDDIRESGTPAREPDAWGLEFQRRMEARGVAIQLPNAPPDWEPPELLHVEGELASEALIRMRRATRL